MGACPCWQPVINQNKSSNIDDDLTIIPESFLKIYHLGQQIGVGSTSKVYIAKGIRNGIEYACKMIDKRRLNILPQSIDREAMMTQFRRETTILKNLQHQNIIHFYDSIETRNTLFIIMEYVSGIDLFQYLLEKGPLNEQTTRVVMQSVFSAVTYLHDQGVVHRDIKTENIIITNHDTDTMVVKIIDFGFSTSLHNDLTGSFLGTRGYLAPEMLQQRLYGTSVDVWSCGVVAYVLMSGQLPFDSTVLTLEREREVCAAFFAVPFLPKCRWRCVSSAAKDLLLRCLDTDPIRRITAHSALCHPWLQEGMREDIKAQSLLKHVPKTPQIGRPHRAIEISKRPSDPGLAALVTCSLGNASQLHQTALNFC